LLDLAANQLKWQHHAIKSSIAALGVHQCCQPSYNKQTKSNLKIYQIYINNKNIQFNAIFSMSFYCFM